MQSFLFYLGVRFLFSLLVILWVAVEQLTQTKKKHVFIFFLVWGFYYRGVYSGEIFQASQDCVLILQRLYNLVLVTASQSGLFISYHGSGI